MRSGRNVKSLSLIWIYKWSHICRSTENYTVHFMSTFPTFKCQSWHPRLTKMIYLLMKSEVKRYQICFLLLQVPKLLSHDAARNNAGTRSTRRQQDNHTNDNVKPPNKGQLMCGELLQRKTLYTDCVSWWQFRGPFCPACFHHSSLVLVILYDFNLGNCTAFREA